MRALGRTRLGGSCGLFGNGMAFDAAVLRGRQWSGHLTEDMEYQNELLLAGTRVVYAPGASIEAEMPDTLQGATGQNERWELGRLQMAKRYVPRLARRVAQRSSPTRRADIDAVLDHLVPPLSVLALLNAATLGSATLLRLLSRRRRGGTALALSSAGSAVVVGHVIAGLWTSDAPAWVYRSLSDAPKAVLWKARLWQRMVTSPTGVAWNRTARNIESTTADADGSR